MASVLVSAPLWPGWLALSWAAGGCAQKGDNRFIYLRGTTPRPLVKASVPGTYALFPEDSRDAEVHHRPCRRRLLRLPQAARTRRRGGGQGQGDRVGRPVRAPYYWAPPKDPKAAQAGK